MLLKPDAIAEKKQMDVACYIRDENVFTGIHEALNCAGYHCERFHSANFALRTFVRRRFDLILIDLEEGIRGGEGIFSWLNCRTGDCTPVILLSSIRDSDVMVKALNAGADDFMIRPLSSSELLARIRALLRRVDRRKVCHAIELAGFFLDRETGQFSYQGVPIELTPREFTIAWLFFSAPGTYVSRATIGSAVWGMDSAVAGRAIEQHVYKLRKKLQHFAEGRAIIRTAYNLGYRLDLID